jgi:hypothetical protein
VAVGCEESACLEINAEFMARMRAAALQRQQLVPAAADKSES